ncbi:acetyl-coenzyme A transporter 1-like [Branchiostoma lanceolatum]|uniref:acetyl-coenzyme A transporter 1-like n=1 Tax=Branchiostoma lanceolatum TaxID=7740 RepID=UPI0034534393
MSRQRGGHPMQTRSRRFDDIPLEENSEKVVIDGRRNEGRLEENHIDTPSDSDSDMFGDNGKPDLTGDRHNIALLLLLYILQGIPLGLAGSVPMLLQQSKHISYHQQAVFSFVFWPFSVKLAWAPIVDAIYSKRMGRRKSWMVPSQYLIGIFMLFLSTKVDHLLGGEDSPPDVKMLTFFFFMLNFLAATQDIAVDGWALTMLSRKNVGWASTCNSVGQTAGYFLGYVMFLALESATFCNKYLRSEPQTQGMMTLAGFLYFWGIVFMVTTTVVWIFKRERAPRPSEVPDEQHGIVSTYLQLWDVVRLPAVKAYAIILLTHKIGFAAADAATGLKLIEKGVQRENLALLAVPLTPIQILLPFVISRYTAGPRPMDTFLKAMPFRLLLGIELAVMVFLTPYFKNDDGTFPLYYYVMIVASYSLHQVALYSMFVSTMAFHAQISDPVIGGTYMTLLNTLANLGGNWPSTFALWLVDDITWSRCDGVEGLMCGSADLNKACEVAGGTCSTWLDGYYIESAACLVIGFIWLKLSANTVRKLQNKELSAWSASS